MDSLQTTREQPAVKPATKAAEGSEDQLSAMVRLGLPKGRMQAGVLRLMSEAGMDMAVTERDYRPSGQAFGLDVKVLKPQNIVEMLEAGSRDLGFAGADWVAELGVRSEERRVG